MTFLVRAALCAAVLAGGCRRPAAPDPWAYEKNPGLDPHPTGQTLEGTSGPALKDIGFRLDPARGTKEIEAEAQTGREEDAIYLEAARSGQAWAQTRLGTKYVQQEDLQTIGEGLRWLNAAADQNDAEALRVLSALAANGRGMDQSDKEAYVYMRRAADLGSPEAQYELANMLANGRGMPRDTEAALIWGRKAAEQGYAPAQFSLGRGLIASVEQERKTEAMDLLQKSVDQGNIEAVLFLATAVGKGDFGLPKDEARAEALLLPWAEKGNADCQFVLAALYQHGETFAERRSEARSWLRRAADQGHSRALEILAREEDRTSAQ